MGYNNVPHFNKGDKPRNKYFTIPMLLDGKTSRGEQYDTAELVDILTLLQKDEVTKMISIPVYGPKKLFLDGDRPGFMVIGYVDLIDVEHEEITLSVFANYTDKIESFDDPTITFRVIIDNREHFLKQIIGIDVCPMAEIDHR